MKKIVITGVTRGLGRALANEFIKLGHTVWGCGRSAELVNEMKNLYPEPNKFEVIDVTDADQILNWATALISDFGAPDILLNNAAIMNNKAPLWEISPEEFAKITDININGVVNSIHAFVPEMVKQKTGVIINLSSGWGRFTSPNVAPYCASKFAIEGLSKSLAMELPEGMISVPLSPGIINTDMLKQVFGSEADTYGSAEKWAVSASNYILNISPEDNGKSLAIENY